MTHVPADLLHRCEAALAAGEIIYINLKAT